MQPPDKKNAGSRCEKRLCCIKGFSQTNETIPQRQKRRWISARATEAVSFQEGLSVLLTSGRIRALPNAAKRNVKNIPLAFHLLPRNATAFPLTKVPSAAIISGKPEFN